MDLAYAPPFSPVWTRSSSPPARLPRLSRRYLTADDLNLLRETCRYRRPDSAAALQRVPVRSRTAEAHPRIDGAAAAAARGRTSTPGPRVAGIERPRSPSASSAYSRRVAGREVAYRTHRRWCRMRPARLPTALELATVSSRSRPDSAAARAAAPAPEEEAVVPETAEAEFVSLEDADAEAQGQEDR